MPAEISLQIMPFTVRRAAGEAGRNSFLWKQLEECPYLYTKHGSTLMQEWMNGQYLHQLPTEEIVPLLAEQWTSSGLLKK